MVVPDRALAVAAGRATLTQLSPGLYARLDALGAALEAGLRPTIKALGMSFARVGSMFTLFFRSESPRNFNEVKECCKGNQNLTDRIGNEKLGYIWEEASFAFDV